MKRTTSEGVPARGPVADTPVLFDAIELTMRTFEERSRLYRNLVVAISLVSVASIASALVWWHGLPLVGLAVVVPLTGLFTYCDTRRVSNWREEILDMCETRNLDLTTLRATLIGFKHLPQGSVQAMLATLHCLSER